MFMVPVIGIPLSLDDRGRWRSGCDYEYIDAAYANAIAATGAIPVYIPLQADGARLIERIDGLLIPGGDDFLPANGEGPYPDVFTPTPQARINADRRLLARALQRRVPVLGICYGMQLLALHHGGILLYHIATDLPHAGDHRAPEADARHGLRVEPESRLARLLGVEPDAVNSLHHQGVKNPGEGMCATAWADDGVIEAIESLEHPFCVGVQWHPEKMTGLHRTALFEAFVVACAEPSRA